VDCSEAEVTPCCPSAGTGAVTGATAPPVAVAVADRRGAGNGPETDEPAPDSRVGGAWGEPATGTLSPPESVSMAAGGPMGDWPLGGTGGRIGETDFAAGGAGLRGGTERQSAGG